VDAPVIDVAGLTKAFNHTTAVDGISFQVHRGELLGFLGPNGAGKTTTIAMLLGLIAPGSGSTGGPGSCPQARPRG